MQVNVVVFYGFGLYREEEITYPDIEGLTFKEVLNEDYVKSTWGGITWGKEVKRTLANPNIGLIIVPNRGLKGLSSALLIPEELKSKTIIIDSSWYEQERSKYIALGFQHIIDYCDFQDAIVSIVGENQLQMTF